MAQRAAYKELTAAPTRCTQLSQIKAEQFELLARALNGSKGEQLAPSLSAGALALSPRAAPRPQTSGAALAGASLGDAAAAAAVPPPTPPPSY